MRKLIIGILIIAVMVGGGLLLLKRIQEMRKKDKNKNAVAEKFIPVITQEIIRTDMVETASTFGSIKAINQVDVYTKVSGRVIELLVKNGETVREEDTLAILETSAIEAQMRQAVSAHESAQAQLKQLKISIANAEKELSRIQELHKEGAVSDSRRDQVETQYKTSLAQKEAIEAQIRQLDATLELANINYTEAHIGAPISGIISQRYIDLGDMVTPQRPVFTIIQTEKVKATAAIPENIIARVIVDKTPAIITVDAYPNKNFDGLVTYVSPAVDPRSRSLDIEIELDNKNVLLKAGMFCRIELMLEQKKNVIAVSKDMLVYNLAGNDIQDYALFVVQGNKAKKIVVKTGIYSKGLVEIKEGLMEGDKVITTVGSHLFDGCKIEIVNK
ncbi:MAG: efflux RND transporter periplasmic adaptor subunit [Candidatus Brocadiia bacterium]